MNETNFKGTPTNLSVYNCDTKGIEHTYPIFSRKNNGLKSGYKIINPEVVTQKLSKDFQTVECKNFWNCPQKQYTNHDPRLTHGVTGNPMSLNTVPIYGGMKLSDISSEKILDGYGQNYKTYKDINAGQITYYESKAIEDPHHFPNFVSSTTTKGYLFKDPMGSVKPYYERVPEKERCEFDEKRGDSYEGCLSWVHDSNNFREDIMSKQMGLRNRQRWQPRWSE